MQVKKTGDLIRVSDFGKINLDLTLDCGQAFRWEKTPDGFWRGCAFSKSVKIKQEGDSLLFSGADETDIREIWAGYFDLDRDYGSILSVLSRDPAVAKAISENGTIRILNQEPWEALCSFIISACNNIPRIKGIVKRLCENFGEELEPGEFSFPSAAVLAEKSEGELEPLRAGYRVPYILDAAKKVADGTVDLEKLRRLSEEDARAALMTVNGVGKKVADCTLLFSLGFSSVFPADRHIIRAMAQMYPDGMPECFSVFKGLAQQYIFCVQRDKS